MSTYKRFKIIILQTIVTFSVLFGIIEGISYTDIIHKYPFWYGLVLFRWAAIATIAAIVMRELSLKEVSRQ